MYLRLTVAALVAVLLTATHWKAYLMGEHAVRVQLQAQALKDSETARQREAQLATTVEKLDHDLQRQKARNAALDRAHAERVRQFEAALERAREDAPAAGGIAEPLAAIAGECGRALRALDQHDRELARLAEGLQRYAAGVCVTVPAGH